MHTKPYFLLYKNYPKIPIFRFTNGPKEPQKLFTIDFMMKIF